ncbi:MAG TPA: hypothetical protein VIG25_00250 [Pyrinomonadaceae bacterium]|jgi:hypothetical protein
MTTTKRRVKATVAALLIYSTLQLAGQAAFAGGASSVASVSVPQQLVGRLSTRDNKPVMVNGLSAATGASVASGATIETKAEESASVNVGPLGRLDISPNTKVVLTFGPGELKALVNFGCVKLTALKNIRGEVATEQGTVGTTDPATGGVIENCKPGTTPAVVGQGGGGVLFGLDLPQTIAVLTGGGLAALTPLFFQENPSKT